MPTVRTNGVDTYYERRGEGPPVVFVHASMLDHTAWWPQFEALSDDYTTVTYDLRGHGRTGGSAVADYTADLYADDLAALVDGLDLGRPVICGLSWGGAVAQVYATRYPEKLSGLVLAETFTPGDWRWPERLQWAMLGATVLPARLVGYQRVERAMVWMQECVQGKGVSGDYGNVEEIRAQGPSMTTAEFAKVIAAMRRFPHTALDLSTVAVPTLVLYGEHELGFVKRHAARMAAAIPGARIEEVPGGGHAANLDNPDFYTAVLREFLGRVDGDREDADAGAPEDADSAA